MAKFVLTGQMALLPPKNLAAIAKNIKSKLSNINVNINVQANVQAVNNAANAANNASTAFGNVAKQAKSARNSVSDLFKSLSGAAKRFGAIAIVTSTFLGLSRAIRSSIHDAIEFERQILNLSQVTGKSAQELKGISNEITRLSVNLGVSSDGLLKTGIILAQAGLEARKTKAALEVLAKTELAASFDDIQSTTEGAIAILQQFKGEAAEAASDVAYLEKAMNSINQISKKYAVESADLVAVIRRSGGAFEAAGGSLDELLALFTSVRATTRESAETIATGLRTIFTRIQRVETIRQLQELGIALQDAEGKFVGPYEAIKRISEGLSSIDARDFRFAAIVEELGGFRQIGKVIPLIKQFKMSQDALKTAQSSGNSLSEDAAIAQKSLANQIARVREEFQALIREFVDSKAFRDMLNLVLEMSRAFINVAKSLEPILPMITILAGMKFGSGLAGLIGGNLTQRRNNGGRIHAFASGGFVPGSGNRDTVPAMLTPGEFVIRKSSVNKIGADKLAQMNAGGSVQHFASGGIVENLIKNPSGHVGIMKLDGSDQQVKTAGINPKDNGNNNSMYAKWQHILSKHPELEKKDYYNIKDFPVDTSGPLNQQAVQTFREGIRTSASQAIQAVAGTIQGALNIKPSESVSSEYTQKLMGSLGDGVIGSLFEGVITALISNGDPSKINASTLRPFDYVGSIGDAAKLFKNGNLLNTDDYMYKDAKKSSQYKISGITEKVINQAYVEAGGAQKVLDAGGTTKADLLQAIEKNPKIKNLLETTGGLTTNDIISLHLKGLKTSTVGQMADKLNELGLYPEARQGTRGANKAPATIFMLKDEIARTNVQEFAAGGMPKGSDTVPAMLTPGEFVVNRDSARKIGYDNLSHMNKTGKPKYFATGGPVTPGKANRQGVSYSGTARQKQDQRTEVKAFLDLVKQKTVAAGGTKTTQQIYKEAFAELKTLFPKLSKVTRDVIAKNLAYAKTLRATEEQQLKAWQAQKDAEKKVQDFGDKISNFTSTTQNWVFLSSSIAAVAAQLGGFEQATKDAISETSIFATTVVGIAGTIADSAVGLAQLIPLSVQAKIYTGVMAGLTTVTSAFGVSLSVLVAPIAALGVLIAGVGIYFYYLKARAKNLAEAANKAADDILQSAEQGKGGTESQFVSKRLEAVAAVQEQYWFSTKAVKDQELEASRQAASVLFNLSVSGKALEQALARIEKDRGLSERQKADQSISILQKDLNNSLAGITKGRGVLNKFLSRDNFNAMDLEGPDKTAFEDANNAVKLAEDQITDNLTKLSSALDRNFDSILKELDFQLIGKTGKEIVDSLKASSELGRNIEAIESSILQSAQQKAVLQVEKARNSAPEDFASAIEAANNELKTALETIYDNRVALENAAKAEAEKIKSTNDINAAMEKQRDNFALADGAIRFFSQQTEAAAKSVSALERTMDRLGGGVNTGSAVSIRGLDNLNDVVDTGLFKSQLDKAVAPLGDFGNVVSDELSKTAIILERGRKKLLNVRFGQLNVIKTIEELFNGIDITADLKNAISGLIQDAAKASTEGASTITASEFENIFAPLLAQSEPFRKTIEGLINTQKELTTANASYLNEINKLRQEEIDGRRKMVDSDIRLSERLAEVRDKTISVEEKEAQRNTRRGFGAGNRNGLANQFRVTADSLRELQGRIEKSNDVVLTSRLQEEQADLINKFSNLKGVVEELTDQTDRATDVMSEIQKEQGKRDFVNKFTADFVTGGKNDRKNIARQFEGLQAVGRFGTLQVLNEEMRGQVGSLLNELAGLDDGFKQFRKQVIFNDAVRLGINPGVAGAIANATPKEEMLIQELRAIAAEEKQFQQLLNDNIVKETQFLYDRMNKLTLVIESMPDKFKEAMSTAMQEFNDEQARIQANAKQYEIDQKKLAAEAEAKKLKDEQAKSDFVAQKTGELTSTLQKLIDVIESERLEKSTEKTESSIRQLQTQNRFWDALIYGKAATNKSKGGPIYASKGKLVNMEPKGTDTVPAMLTPGEFVMRKSAVDKYGEDTMHAINKGVYADEGGSINKKYRITKDGYMKTVQDGKTYTMADKIKDQERERAARDKALSDKNTELLSNPRLSRNRVEPDYPISDTKNPSAFQTTGFDNNLLGQIVGQQYSNIDLGGPDVSRINQAALQQAQSIKIPPSKAKPAIATASNVYGQADPKILKELGGTYGSGRHHDPQKQLALAEKRRQEQVRARDIRMGQIDPTAERRQSIQDRLNERSSNIQQAAYQRKQRSLPSYMRDEGWQDKKFAPQNIPQLPQGGMGRPNFGQNNPQMGNMNDMAGVLKTTFDNLTGVLNNMHMTHQVTVDGALNINGINNTQVAEAIKQYLGDFIVTEVKRLMDDKGLKT